MVLHYDIKIIGKVQGIWFRDSTRKKALELGITGFVRNEPEGSVYIEAEGDEGALKKLVEWCRKGPEKAKVEIVEVENGVIRLFEIFEIRRF